MRTVGALVGLALVLAGTAPRAEEPDLGALLRAIPREQPTPPSVGTVAVWDGRELLGTFSAIEGAAYALDRCEGKRSFIIVSGGSHPPHDEDGLPYASASTSIGAYVRRRADGGCELYVDRARMKLRRLRPDQIPTPAPR